VFDALRPPSRSLGRYFRNLWPTDTPADCLTLALVYVARLQASPLAREHGVAPLTRSSVFLVVFTAAVLAMKYWDDDSGKMAKQCKRITGLAGVPEVTLGQLEMAFLKAIDYRLGFTAEEFQDFQVDLLRAELASRAAPKPCGSVSPRVSPAVSPRLSPAVSPKLGPSARRSSARSPAQAVHW